MSFSSEWDQRYVENTHMWCGLWSVVLSLARCHCASLDEKIRVLELGCGAGNIMNPRATLIGVDWFSTSFREYAAGEHTADPIMRTGYRSGTFEGTGKVHFADEAHLRGLLSRIDLVFLEERGSCGVVPQDDVQFASRNFVARKQNA